MRGIYKITNEVNGKVYIGKSENLERRIEYHIKSLNYGQNKNKHLQNAFNKYGCENFNVTILETLNENEDINKREKYWINNYKAYDRDYGYNRTLGGDGGNSYVECMTEEEKEIHSQIMSEVHKGEKNPVYGKHCYTNGETLKYFTDEEAKLYIERGWYKGIPESIRQNERVGNAGDKNGFYGKKHTEKTKKYLSESRTGKNNWNYGRLIYHKGNKQIYIAQNEVEKYESDGWVKGMHPDNAQKIRNSKLGKKQQVPNSTAYIYFYEGEKYYGWRRLQSYLRANGYPKISEVAIVKLSKGLHVRGYDNLFGKITIIKQK